VDKAVEKDVGNAENRCHACAAMLRLQKWHVSWRPCWSAAVAADGSCARSAGATAPCASSLWGKTSADFAT
jgi:hypothetical protein